DDFDGFVLSKSLWHPELSELKESTFKKLRSTIFRMLVEAGLLVDGRIVQAILSQRVNSLLETSDPTDLRFFPTRSDKEEMV
ncbi:MAG: BrxA family protein, partial [Scrofimicrobium sp.]